MSYSTAQIWIIIAGLAVGTYLIRFSFLGLLGDRKLPPLVMAHLRYTAVAIIPGLVAPLVLWPDATGGAPDALRIGTALTVVAVGWFSRNTLAAILAGAAILGIGWGFGL